MRLSDSDEYAAPSRAGSRIKWIIFTLFLLLIVFVVIGQIIWFWLNIVEFGDLYIRPIYYALLGGLVLSAIAFFRVDYVNRRSLVWWGIRLGLRVLRSRGYIEEVPPEYLDFKRFKLSPFKFTLWQVTKMVGGMLVMGNILFGLAMAAALQGYGFEIGRIWGLFSLPFVTPPFDMAYAQAHVIPLIPSLTLLVSPILSAIGLRLILLVGLTLLIKAFSPGISELGKPAPQFRAPVATFEALVALGLFWTAFNLFFPSFIDYNTKLVIGGVVAGGVLFALFAFFDGVKRKLLRPSRRGVLLRFLSVIILILIVGSAFSIQNSIADARKVEWRGPYTIQQIAVNRYLAELDRVREVPYEFGIKPISPERINSYVTEHRGLLSEVRLWDWEAAFAKLKPEIGLIPYVDFEDSDILRFNGSLYWSASMKPVLPTTVRPEDEWYANHLVYTHAPNGFLLLSGNTGVIADTSSFFTQRKIYYGEGGLLDETWAAYPVDRQTSDELEGAFYTGRGGVDVPPPLSWIFDATFLFSLPDKTIHTLRYRDVHERMELLFPYFVYRFGGEEVDMLPVSDGEHTYWLMPLIVALDGRNVPWSTGNPMLRLVGYALIDTYNGDIQLIITGDDFFTELFKTLYADYVTENVPGWLWDQLRYPEELFAWRVSMYNLYHVMDAATFIIGRLFFEVPEGLDTYYIVAKPPGLEKQEFLGLLSLELAAAPGRNLAGYMVVRNDYPHTGEMTYYEVDIESPTKLLGPSAAIQALERNPDFAQLRTLLRTPRVGDNILYRIGDYDVYFIPVYTAGAGGVVAELGTVAVVGAAFTGEYQVALAAGGSAEEAFRVFLAEIGGVAPPPPPAELGREERLRELVGLLEEKGLSAKEPTAVVANAEFLEGRAQYISEEEREGATELLNSLVEDWVEPYGVKSVLMWPEDTKMNVGVLVNVEGIVELHYVSIDLGA